MTFSSDINILYDNFIKCDISQERDEDREKIRVLTEENAQLQFEKKSSMNESTNLEQELESARLRISGLSTFGKKNGNGN